MDTNTVELINNITPLLTGAYLIFIALVMATGNLISAFIFKFVPMMFGIASIIQGLKLLGII